MGRLLLALAVFVAAPVAAESGSGPYPVLVIRGATIVTGDGAPPYGPANIVVRGWRIAEILPAGTPGLSQKPDRLPRGATREIDATGMHVLPGFVDMHGPHGNPATSPDPAYAYKLWLASGLTTVRGVPFYGDDVAHALADKRASAAGTLVAPTRWAVKVGVDGVKFFNRGDETPAIDRAAIDEAKNWGWARSHICHRPMSPSSTPATPPLLVSVRGPVSTAISRRCSRTGGCRRRPPLYNYNDEQDRFGGIATIWDQIYDPSSPEWRDYLTAQKATGVTFDPTFTIYSASRDLMPVRNADW